MSVSTWTSEIHISARIGAVTALVCANAIWGTTFVATKPVLDRVPPITLTTVRFAIALLVLWPLLAVLKRRPILNRTTAAMGFLGVLMVYGCQNIGLTYTGACNAALIHGALPVFTILIAAPALGESICGRRLLGLVLSLIGLVTVILCGSADDFGVSILGDGLMFVSVVALATFLVIGRMVFSGQHPLEIIGGVIAFGILFLVPVSGIELAVGGMSQPTHGDVMGLMYLGAVASALTFVLTAYGLRHLSAGQAATFANLKLLVGVVVAAVSLNETISALQLSGGLLMVVGLWLTARPSEESASPTSASATWNMVPATTNRHFRSATMKVALRLPVYFWCPTQGWKHVQHHGPRTR